MKDLTITDVLNVRNAIIFNTGHLYISSGGDYTWSKMKKSISFHIKHFEKIGDYEKSEKLKLLLNRCPYRKRY